MAGNIYIIDSARVRPVDVPVTAIFKCMTKWGTGSGGVARHNACEAPGRHPSQKGSRLGVK